MECVIQSSRVRARSIAGSSSVWQKRFYRIFPPWVRDIRDIDYEDSSSSPPVVMDIGMNDGAWAIQVVRRFPAVRVVGVEANPRHAARLRRIPYTLWITTPGGHFTT